MTDCPSEAFRHKRRVRYPNEKQNAIYGEIDTLMSHPSKVKGNSWERAIVDAAKARGLDARRAYGSNGMALGKHPEVDCTVDVYDVQAKRRKTLPSYLQIPDCCDVVAFRQDRGPALVLMTMENWLDTVVELKEKKA